MDGIDTILFDWDGTLIDTSRYSFIAFQKALRDLGIEVKPEIYESIYSPSWYSMYQSLNLPADQWQQAEDLWIHYYEGESAQLVPEGLHTLNELSRRGYCLGIVTSGSRPRVQREVSRFCLSDVFRAIVCNEDVVNKKPHPDGLNTAMRRIGKSPGVCCYVGDSPEDIEMGKRAGVRTVGILSGYPNSKKIMTADANLCFNSIHQLLNHFGPLENSIA